MTFAQFTEETLWKQDFYLTINSQTQTGRALITWTVTCFVLNIQSQVLFYFI